MKFKGINYNAGIEYEYGGSLGSKVDISRLHKDLEMIKDLNCNSIRMYGSHLDKLILYSEEALKKGFYVWISPRLVGGVKSDTLSFVKKVSIEAEKLRLKYKKVIFIVGNELLLDSKYVFGEKGFVEKKENLKAYMNFKWISKVKTSRTRKISLEMEKFVNRIDRRLNCFLKDLVKISRNNFSGKITYASFPEENVDWSIFDIVSINFYRNQWNYGKYVEKIREWKSFRREVAITEFGTCSYVGASKLGGAAYSIVDYSKGEIIRDVVRSEKEQADYLKELIELYKKENVDGAFVFDFKEEWKVYSAIKKKDLDVASFGIVGVKKNGEHFKKKSFGVVKKLYRDK